MVDILRFPEGRDYARLTFDTERPFAPSRRSSISSRAESEASVFSDRSIASSQSSVSLHPSSGWESSTPYDSDEESYLGSYIDVSDQESASYFADAVQPRLNSDLKPAGPRTLPRHAGDVDEYGSSTNLSRSDSQTSNSYLDSASLRRDTAAPTATQINSGPISNNKSECPFVRPLHPSQTGRNAQNLKHTLSHPRRTATDPGWSKPSLVTQDEQRLNFVENLVGRAQQTASLEKNFGTLTTLLLADTATELVAIIWPTSVNPVFPDGQRTGTPIISLRFFIRETLRRSRTSFSTLQVAMYYLALLNCSGNLPKCDLSKEQRSENLAGRALQCGRRMFLASLILASKYLQDRNYFTKAWSRISNLSVAEINKNEMALLSALEYKLHIKAAEFQRWTDCISKCTASVQHGFDCPWVEALKVMNMWNNNPVPSGTSDSLAQHKTPGKRSFGATELDVSSSSCSPFKALLSHQPRSSTIPAHRLNLLRAGHAVNPTRPMCLPMRPPVPGHGDLQWRGMASHLSSMVRCGIARGAPATASSRPAQSADGGARSTLPLSPPKTPSPQSRDVEIRDDYTDAESNMEEADASRPVLPPAPREPLVSLNTTPDSNDGASTFGNYLSPISSDSTQVTVCGNDLAPQLSHSSDARFQADALDRHEKAGASGDELPGLTSPSSSPSIGSFDLPSPELKHMEFLSSPNDKDHQRPALNVVDTDTKFEISEAEMAVIADDKVAITASDIEAETRRLTRMDIAAYSKNVIISTSTPTVDEKIAEPENAIPAEDSTSRPGAKRCRAQKQPPCHRRKRGASTLSSGLPLRTKKAMRV